MSKDLPRPLDLAVPHAVLADLIHEGTARLHQAVEVPVSVLSLVVEHLATFGPNVRAKHHVKELQPKLDLFPLGTIFYDRDALIELFELSKVAKAFEVAELLRFPLSGDFGLHASGLVIDFDENGNFDGRHPAPEPRPLGDSTRFRGGTFEVIPEPDESD